MKKWLAMLLTLCLMLAALPALAEADTDDRPVITALGTATVTLVPDMATFTVGVTTQQTLVAAAQSANATAMQSVLDALKALGIDAKDMQTDNYTVSPVYDYQNTKLDSQQILIGYAVTNNVTVTVRQLDQLPALLDAAVAAGANQTYGINFQSSKSDEAYDQALAAAAKDAVRKAGLLATALGRAPGDLISVQEANDAYPAYASSKSAVYDSAATPIETGTLSVAANVRVQMALQ